ncbi:uncharacterized protein LOC117182797 [Belonocnema kinseyi]|uniref:uncharacterized protein LOC117182797 n=1 Tax=Belonocnema kinseyi TaxID=2817044 RepID=UPI00143D38EB|nr:uncharacterized protein LOC117182797 [Belonocnema kinseyi]
MVEHLIVYLLASSDLEKSTGQNVWPDFGTTYISSNNKPGTKTLLEYEIHKTLDIKEEIIQVINLQAKSEPSNLTGILYDGQYFCTTSGISPSNNPIAETLIEYDDDEFLEFKEEIIQDLRAKRASKKFTGRQDGWPDFCTTTHTFLNNKSGANTLFEYDIDESLNIKEEIIQDPETTDKIRNKKYESKSCVIDKKKDDTFAFETKVRSQKKQKIQKSKQEPRSNKFKRKCHMSRHVDLLDLKTNLQTSKTSSNCDKSTQSYIFPNSLCRHKREEHAAVKPQFICDYCKYETNRKRILQTHITLRHSQNWKSKHKCDKCWRSYRRLSGLIQHKCSKHAEVKLL